MRLHRFYVKEKIESEKDITVRDEQLIHQWRNVFRMKAGDKVILFDGGGGDFICGINSISKDKAVLEIIEKKRNTSSFPKVHLYFSLPKKDKAEWIIEKGTELGVSHFIPVVSERSEKKNFNMERARKIAVEASEQSFRSDVPEVEEVSNLEDALNDLKKVVVFPYVFDQSGESFRKYSFTHEPMAFFVGPEGGFSESELNMFKKKGIPVLSLGKQVLKAETAAIVASALALI